MFGISRMWMAVTRAVSGGEPVVGNAFNITIDHTKVDEDLYDFPLLVNLGSSSVLIVLIALRFLIILT